MKGFTCLNKKDKTITTMLLNTFITTLTSSHDPCLGWRAWEVQSWVLLGLALEVAWGEEEVDQGG